MKVLGLALAIFFAVFALADIALAGACCEEESAGGNEDESSCFCCTYVMIDHPCNVITEQMNLPLMQTTGTLSDFVFLTAIYHPPRLP